EVGLAFKQPLHDPGQVAASASFEGTVQLLLGQCRQPWQSTGHLARVLVQCQQGLQLVGEAVAVPALRRELEGDGPGVLAHLVNDPGLGQLATGASESVPGCQLTGNPLVQAAVTQGLDQVEVLDTGARAAPRDDLSQQASAGGDGRQAVAG